MSRFFQDLRFALRTLVGQPAYSLMVVGMLALGIAANTAIFSIFNGLFLRPLPFPDSRRLVDFDQTAPRWELEYVSNSYPDFYQWRAENSTFQGMAVFDNDAFNLSLEGEAQRVDAALVTHDMAEVLGITPVLGRDILPEEDMPDASRVALVGYGLWQSQFGGDPDVVGRTLRLDAEPYTVIGVLPREARFLGDADLWVPLSMDVDTNPYSWFLKGIGRLGEGVTAEQAQQDLFRIHKNMIDTREVNEITSPVVQPILDRYLGEYRLGGTALLGAVALVLLIACANIAGLMLARSLSRGREISIRVAMGAGRWRIIRQTLTESLVLAVAGGAAGAAMGFAGVRWLTAAVPEDLPSWIQFDADVRVIVFTFVVVVAAAVLAGLFPALQVSGADPGEVLQEAASRSSSSGSRRHALSTLVVGEVALAVVLLVVAGLSMRDFRQLQAVDPGFRAEGVLTYRVALPEARYEGQEDVLRYYEEHRQRLSAVPGVESVALASTLPMDGHWGQGIEVENAPPRDPDEPTPIILNRLVTPGYLATMGVTLLAGRDLVEGDGREEGSHAALVNETFVRRFFPEGTDPLGQRIRYNQGAPWMRVVGVTRDVKHYGLDEEMRPGIYVPLAQQRWPYRSMVMILRTSMDPLSLVAPARRVVQEMDPDLPVFDVTTLADQVAESQWTRRASSWLFSVFSALALALAIGGIYGVISYQVSQRNHEMSIRLALGAQCGQVTSQVLRQGMVLVATGLALGLVAAYAVARGISGMMFGVGAADPLVYLGVTILLLLVALVANFLPARRAGRVDPMQSLRGG